jgi:hypothetical protein
MARPPKRSYTTSKAEQDETVHTLMAEKTRLLRQAQALVDLGMPEAARPLWLEIAGREERIAPLLDALGQHREAAVHRISAASCYEKGRITSELRIYIRPLSPVLSSNTRVAKSRRCSCSA